MTYLIDTNVVSDARRNRAPVVRWLQSVDPDSIYLSVITLGEIRRGVLGLQTRNPASAAPLSSWLQALRREFRQRTLPISDEVAIEWGRISAVRSRGIGDSWIAATALVHGLAVVTRDVADFDDTGVQVIDPWALPEA